MISLTENLKYIPTKYCFYPMETATLISIIYFDFKSKFLVLHGYFAERIGVHFLLVTGNNVKTNIFDKSECKLPSIQYL